MIQTPTRPKIIVPQGTYTNKYDVSDIEQAVIGAMRQDVHPQLINQGRFYRGIDATSDIGEFDIQYRTSNFGIRSLR